MKHDHVNHSKRAKTRMAKLQLDLIGWQGGAGDFFKPTTAWAEAESKEIAPDILNTEVKPVHTLNRVYENTQHKDVSQTFLLPSCWLKEFSMKVQKTTFFAQSLSEIKNNSYYRNKVKPVMLSL